MTSSNDLSREAEDTSSSHRDPPASSKVTKDKSSKKRKSSSSAAPLQIKSGSSEETPIAAVPTMSNTTTAAEQSKSSIEEAHIEPAKKRRKLSVEEIEVDVTAREPPSKKALRALKKGKPLPPSKSGAESTPEPEPKKQKKSEVEKRSEHGVWIGNLAWTTSKEDLRKFLVDNSEITEETITRIHMPGPDDKKSANKVEERKNGKRVHNKGFAYVDFANAKAIKWAIDLSELLLAGRRVLIKDNKSFEGRPEKPKEETWLGGKPPSKRVFLGNLSFDTTEDSIKEHFAKCGAIESVKVATFEDSGKCKGYAWIVFEDLEAAKHAVRGFVPIEEEESGMSDTESDDGAEAEKVSTKPTKIKTKKWWVNRIKGRPLRMEFAEDAQVRYKKRYGKDGTKKAATVEVVETPEEPALKETEARPKHEYRQPYAARLTGGIVESKGKKVNF